MSSRPPEPDGRRHTATPNAMRVRRRDVVAVQCPRDSEPSSPRGPRSGAASSTGRRIARHARVGRRALLRGPLTVPAAQSPVRAVAGGGIAQTVVLIPMAQVRPMQPSSRAPERFESLGRRHGSRLFRRAHGRSGEHGRGVARDGVGRGRNGHVRRTDVARFAVGERLVGSRGLLFAGGAHGADDEGTLAPHAEAAGLTRRHLGVPKAPERKGRWRRPPRHRDDRSSVGRTTRTSRSARASAHRDRRPCGDRVT